MSTSLRYLSELARRGLQPARREVWLGLGFMPPKGCAVEINPADLPSVEKCSGLTGLDVLLCYRGGVTRYGVLRSICHSVLNVEPRRLQAIDLDIKKIAYLKVDNS